MMSSHSTGAATSEESRLDLVVGVDEAGRGPLAGPVVAAAVILDPTRVISGIGDSKAIAASQREKIAREIQAHSLAWATGQAEVEEIDRLNILQATLLAMGRAVLALPSQVAGVPLHTLDVLVDGKQVPDIPNQTLAIVRGDKTVPAIGAASIIAKVTRDAHMMALDQTYPQYGFAGHKGYPTRAHLKALDKWGVLPVHRRTFRPVRMILERKDTPSELYAKVRLRP